MVEIRQANREAVFAWLDACNRKPKAELLRIFACYWNGVNSNVIYGNTAFHAYNIQFSLIKLLGETDVPGLNEGGQFIW